MIVKEGDKYVSIVDLGDGSAPQKYYGDSIDELVAALNQAQTHATRTIREQKQIIKLGKVNEPREDDGLTVEQALVISAKFKKSHPDYIESQENEDVLIAYLDTRGYAFTEFNLNLAYEDIKEFLKLRQVEIPQGERVQTRNRTASTGLPSNTSVQRAAPKVGLTVKEITAMPKDEYDRRFRDPKFRAEVDAAYAQSGK